MIATSKINPNYKVYIYRTESNVLGVQSHFFLCVFLNNLMKTR